MGSRLSWTIVQANENYSMAGWDVLLSTQKHPQNTVEGHSLIFIDIRRYKEEYFWSWTNKHLVWGQTEFLTEIHETVLWHDSWVHLTVLIVKIINRRVKIKAQSVRGVIGVQSLLGCAYFFICWNKALGWKGTERAEHSRQSAKWIPPLGTWGASFSTRLWVMAAPTPLPGPAAHNPCACLAWALTGTRLQMSFLL